MPVAHDCLSVGEEAIHGQHETSSTDVQRGLGDDWRRVRGAEGEFGAPWEHRYQPYRRAPSKAGRGKRRPQGESPRSLRSLPGAGLRLHVFPPDKTSNRRRLFLLIVLLAVTAWGAVSSRQGDIQLADLEEAGVELLEAVPILVWEGRELALRMRERLASIS